MNHNAAALATLGTLTSLALLHNSDGSFPSHPFQKRISAMSAKRENGERYAVIDPREPIRVDAKAGRNDPCPCGSGKKFKKCCG